MWRCSSKIVPLLLVSASLSFLLSLSSGMYIINGGSSNAPSWIRDWIYLSTNNRYSDQSPNLTYNNHYIESWEGSQEYGGKSSSYNGQFIDAFYGNIPHSSSLGIINPPQILTFGNGNDVCVSSPKSQCAYGVNNHLIYYCGPKSFSSLISRDLYYIVGTVDTSLFPDYTDSIVDISDGYKTVHYRSPFSFSYDDYSKNAGKMSCGLINGNDHLGYCYIKLWNLTGLSLSKTGYLDIHAYPCRSTGTSPPQCLNGDTEYDKLHLTFKRVNFIPSGSLSTTCFTYCLANRSARSYFNVSFYANTFGTQEYPLHVVGYSAKCGDDEYNVSPFWGNLVPYELAYKNGNPNYVYTEFCAGDSSWTGFGRNFTSDQLHSSCEATLKLVSVSGNESVFQNTTHCYSPLSLLPISIRSIAPSETTYIDGISYHVLKSNNHNVSVSVKSIISPKVYNSENYLSTLTNVDLHLYIYNKSTGTFSSHDYAVNYCKSTGLYCQAKCGCDTSFSTDCTLPGPGRYKLVLDATDVYGRSNSSTSYFYIPSPTVKILYPPNNANVTTCQGFLEWSATEKYGNVTRVVAILRDLATGNIVWSNVTGISPTTSYISRDVFKGIACDSYRHRYKVIVTAYDENGYNGTTSIVIHKTTFPLAKIAFNSNSLDSGYNITFDGSNSYDPDDLRSTSTGDLTAAEKAIKAYYWVYQYPHSGKKVWRYAEGKTFSVLYPNVTGTYQVMLLVVDNEGQINYTTSAFQVGSSGITTITGKPKNNLTSFTASITPTLMVYSGTSSSCGCWPSGSICRSINGVCPSDCSPNNCNTPSNNSTTNSTNNSTNSSVTTTASLNLHILFIKNGTHVGSKYVIPWEYKDKYRVTSSQQVTYPKLELSGISWVNGKPVWHKGESVILSTAYNSPPSYQDLVGSPGHYKFWYRDLQGLLYPPGFMNDTNVTVKVYASGYSGKSYSGKSNVNLYFDTIAPKVKILSPSNGYNATSPYVFVSWNATDKGYGIAYTYVMSEASGNVLWRGVFLPSVSNATIPLNRDYKKTTITVQTCDLSGNCNSTSISVRYTVPPVAVPTIGCPKQHYDGYSYSNYYDVVFNGSKSYDPDGGKILKYYWNFDIPSSKDCKVHRGSASGKYVQMEYPRNCTGTYDVWLTVVDDEGQVDTSQTVVTIPCKSCIDLALFDKDVRGNDVIVLGANQTIRVLVYNLGNEESGPVPLDIYDNGQLVHKENIPSIPAKGVYIFNYTWKPTNTGAHNVKLVVNPNGMSAECNNTNNLAFFHFKVVKSSVDVSISSPISESCVPNDFMLSWDAYFVGCEPDHALIQVYNMSTGSPNLIFHKSIDLSNLQGLVSKNIVIHLPKGIAPILVNLTVNSTGGSSNSATVEYYYDDIPPFVNLTYPNQRRNVTTGTVGADWDTYDVGCGLLPMHVISKSVMSGDTISDQFIAPYLNHTVVVIDHSKTYWPKNKIIASISDLAGNTNISIREIRYTSRPTGVITLCSNDYGGNCQTSQGPDFWSPDNWLPPQIPSHISKILRGLLAPVSSVSVRLPVVKAVVPSSSYTAPLLASPSDSSKYVTYSIDGTKSYDLDGNWDNPTAGGVIKSYSWIYEAWNVTKHSKVNKTSSLSSFTTEYPKFAPGLYGIWLNVTDDENQTGYATATAWVCNNGNCYDPAIMSTDIHLEWETLDSGQNETANITVHNIGNEPLPNDLTVDIYDTGRLVKQVVIPKEYLDKCNPSGGQGYVIHLNWTVDYIGRLKHTLRVVLDPNNVLSSECNETNNEATTVFYVKPATYCHIGAQYDYDEHKYIDPTNCESTWSKICSEFSAYKCLIPCCDSGDYSSCCITKSNVEGWIKNPAYPISFATISTYLSNNDLGTFTYLSPSEWTDKQSKEWNYKGSFSSATPGLYTLYLYGSSVDRSLAACKVRIDVSSSRYPIWPNIGVENIETVPIPATGFKSDIYATITNNGIVPANKVRVIAIVGSSSASDSDLTKDTGVCSSGGNLGSSGPGALITYSITTTSLRPGGTKHIKLLSWTPTKTGTYKILVLAFPEGTGDWNYTDNKKEEIINVGVGRKITKSATIPEYPSYTIIIAMLLVASAAYLISRRE